MPAEPQSEPLPTALRRFPSRPVVGLGVAVCLVAVTVLLGIWSMCPREDTAGNRRLSPLPPLAPEARALRDEAFATAEQLVQQFPQDPDAFYSKAAVHRRLDDSEVAVACWHKCLKLDPEFALAYYCLGWDALDRDQYDHAVDYLQEAVQLDPSIGHAYLLLAEALMDLGRAAEAELPLQTHLRLVPQSVEGHCRLGQVYLEAKNYQRAQQYFLAALEILPTSPTARDGLASALEGLGQSEQAEKYRDAEGTPEPADRREPEVESVSDEVQLAQTRSAAAFGLTDVGRVYGARGDLPEALKLWTRAAEIAPQDLECRQLLVSIYQQSQEFEKALHFLNQLAAIEPGNPVHQVNIGVLASRTGRFEDAEKAFRRVQELAPDRYEGYAGLAKLYLDGNKDAAESKRLAQKAVDLAPIGGNFYLLGLAQLKGGNLKEALTALEQASELERGNLIYRRALDQVRAEIAGKEGLPEHSRAIE